MRATVDARTVLVGNRGFLANQGIDTAHWQTQVDHWRRDAKTVVFFAVDGVASGIVAGAHPIKETTPEAVKVLKAAGVNVVMLTGDFRETAEAVGRQLGIDEVISGVLPEHNAQHEGAAIQRASRGDGR